MNINYDYLFDYSVTSVDWKEFGFFSYLFAFLIFPPIVIFMLFRDGLCKTKYNICLIYKDYSCEEVVMSQKEYDRFVKRFKGRG